MVFLTKFLYLPLQSISDFNISENDGKCDFECEIRELLVN
jgi:hypothetical protein